MTSSFLLYPLIIQNNSLQIIHDIKIWLYELDFGSWLNVLKFFLPSLLLNMQTSCTLIVYLLKYHVFY